MQETYLKHDIFSRILYRMFSKMAFNVLKNHFDSKSLKELKRNSRNEYKQMLKRTPSIGGKNNPAFGGYLMGAALFSIYKASEGSINEKLFEEITQYIPTTSMLRKSFSKRQPFSKKAQEKNTKSALRSQKKAYPMDWVFTHEICDTGYKMTYSKCAVYELAKQEACTEIVKYFCKIDFITYGYMGTQLIKTKTLADGDEMCDFYVVPKTSKIQRRDNERRS